MLYHILEKKEVYIKPISLYSYPWLRILSKNKGLYVYYNIIMPPRTIERPRQ